MLDWYVREDEEPPFSEGASEEDEPQEGTGRSWWRFLLVVGSLVLLLGAMLWLRVNGRQRQMQADVLAFVVEEERVRLSGTPRQALEFVVPNAPAAWRRAYAATFGRPSGTIDAVEVKVQSFDGRCADVEVRLEGHPQWRSYCLVGTEWRRAPRNGEEWGEERQLLLPNRVRLVYRERDAAFAEALADRLPAFFEAQAEWVVHRAGGGLNRSTVRRIVIAPHDGFGPLVSDEEDTIVLNSPLTVAYDGVLAPEAQVRLALAHTLLVRAGPTPRSGESLPGGPRLVEAAHRVAAAHVALSSEERGRLLALWRAQLGERWVSPLFAEFTAPEKARPLAPWAARFLVELVYRQGGLSAVAEMTHALASYGSWDELFGALLGRTTAAVEHQAAALALGREEAVPGAGTAVPRVVPSTPVTATLETVRDGSRLIVRLRRVSRPVLLEVDGRLIHSATNMPVEPECLGAGSQLTVRGEWKERGYRLTGETVLVDRLGLPPVRDTTPPGGRPRSPLAPLEEPLPEEIRAFVATFDPRYGHTVMALGPEGRGRVLAQVNDEAGFWIRPLPWREGESLRFLLAFTTTSCRWSWYAVYEPFTGALGAWEQVPPGASVIWRPDVERVLPVITPSEAASSQVAVVMPHGEVLSFLLPGGYAYVPLGWRLETGEIILLPVRRAEQQPPSQFRLLALKVPGGRTRWLKPPFKAPEDAYATLSPDGRYAAMTTTWQDVIVWDTLQGTWWPVLTTDTEALDELRWGADLDVPTLVIHLGTPVPGVPGEVRTTRYVLFRPDRPGTLAEFPIPGQEMNSAGLFSVLCKNGDLLYTVAGNWPTAPVRLYRHAPGGPPGLVMSSENLVLPLGCP